MKKNCGQNELCCEKSIERCLKCCGYRMTSPRRQLFAFLENLSTYQSAEEIFYAVQSQNLDIGIATIYRTLNLLVDLAYVEKHESADKTLFKFKERRGKEEPTVFLICELCSSVIDSQDLDPDEKSILDSLKTKKAASHNFQTKKQSLHIYGLCEACHSCISTKSE